ncbi:MAG: hypothetical protein KJ042_06165 [Deltaproteobacteria bacterium]|nr:hypothetical protein [Deltaproteobacteria bacterium]
MTFIPQVVVTEGPLDAVAARKVLELVHALPEEWRPVISGSNERFWMDAKRRNDAARRSGVRIAGFADLEKVDACAPEIIAEKLPEGLAATFRLRLAVRMLENWLLADHDAMAKFLGISKAVVEKEVRLLSTHPKTAIVNLARRSKRREIRDALIPEKGSKGLVGPGYTLEMTRFIEEFWNPDSAARNDESLRRATVALRRPIP